LELTERALSKGFSNARLHYQKAAGYLHRHPIDEANSIKEIVSAIETVARTIDPKAATLGDAIKKLRKNPNFNPQLLDGLEKLYGYANRTPLVRHGHAEGSKPTVDEAELLLLSGAAYIRYLIAAKDRSQ
jgi:hypothetical protein